MQSKNQIINNVNERRIEIDENWLGQSMAYNPYTPRDIKDMGEYIGFIPCFDINDSLESVLETIKDEVCVAFNIQTNISHFDKDKISQVRRLKNVYIVQLEPIVSKYQILEALAFGVDGVLLDMNYISKDELAEFVEYNKSTGLESFILIHSVSDLTNAIFMRVDTFIIPFDKIEELKPKIPKNKNIFILSPKKDEKDLEKYSGVFLLSAN